MHYKTFISALIGAIMIQSLPGEEPSKDGEDLKISKTAGPEYYSNVALSLGVGAALGLKDPTLRQFYEAHSVSEAHSISGSTYFYRWSGDPFSEKGMEDLVEKLKPTIEMLGDKYGFKHNGSSFVLKKYAEDYKQDHMPQVCLTFSDPKNDKLTYSCIILVFHTAPTVLAINVTSVFPPLK